MERTVTCSTVGIQQIAGLAQGCCAEHYKENSEGSGRQPRQSLTRPACRSQHLPPALFGSCCSLRPNTYQEPATAAALYIEEP